MVFLPDVRAKKQDGQLKSQEKSGGGGGVPAHSLTLTRLTRGRGCEIVCSKVKKLV